jgi:hypothetical protein
MAGSSSLSLDPPAPGERPNGAVGKVKEYLFSDVPALIWAPQARQLCTEDVSKLEAEFPLRECSAPVWWIIAFDMCTFNFGYGYSISKIKKS